MIGFLICGMMILSGCDLFSMRPGFTDSTERIANGETVETRVLEFQKTPITMNKLAWATGFDDETRIRFTGEGTTISQETMEYLGTLTHLKALAFWRVHLTNDNVKPLGELANIEQLSFSLSGSQLTDKGINHLTGLQKLEYLDISGTGVTGNELEGLDQLVSLKYLIIGGTSPNTPFTEAGMRKLSALKSLEYLHCEGLSIGDDSLSAIIGSEHLTHLNLSGTQVTDEGVKQIATIESLRNINLRATAVTDQGIEYLHNLSDLQQIDLAGSKCTLEGVMALQEKFPQCEIFFNGAVRKVNQENALD